MIGWLVRLALGLLGAFGRFRQPPVQVQLGQATAQRDELEAANDQLMQAARARALADAERVRDDPAANDINPDPAARINRNPDGHFRD